MFERSRLFPDLPVTRHKPIPDFDAMQEGDRNKREIRQWTEILLELSYFRDFTEATLLEAAKCVQAVHYDDGYIFKDGDVGLYFYVIYSGEVAITKEVVLRRLRAGDTFGETAFDLGRRTANAKCEQPCWLLTLYKFDYLRITHQRKEQEITERAKWLTRLPDPIEAARRLTVKLYDPSSIIVKQDDPAENLYIIKKGVVDLFKKIPPSSESTTKTESSWVLQRHWKDVDTTRVYAKPHYKELLVGILGRGQLFGELAVLGGRCSPVTARALTPVVLYTLSKKVIADLELAFYGPLVNFLDESLMLYNPSHEKLAAYLKNRDDWQAKKEAVIATVMSKH